MTRFTIPDSVTRIGAGAFLGCRNLCRVTIPESVVEIADDAFAGCTALIAIDFGRVTDHAAPNRFPQLNGVARHATVEHQIKDSDVCLTRRTWPAGSPIDSRDIRDWDSQSGSGHAWIMGRFKEKCQLKRYAGTAPEPVVTDAPPIPLQDLGGNEYPLHNWWGHGDLKRLAAAQHPGALGSLAAWAVMLPGAESTLDTLDRGELANMLLRGEISLAKPWLLVWKGSDGGDGEGPTFPRRGLTSGDDDGDAGEGGG